MTVYTAAITQVGTEPTPVPSIGVNVRYALRISFGEFQKLWIVSHDDAIPSLPEGSSVSKARLADAPMPDISRNAGFESGKGTTPTATYTIVDVEDDFTGELASKNLNRQSSFNRIVEDFEFELGETLYPDPVTIGNKRFYTQPIYTGIILDHSRDYNTVSLETSNINRKLDDNIFDPLVWRLRETITSTTPNIPTTLPIALIGDYQARWQQADWYEENPGELGGYIRIKDEVIWYSQFTEVNGVATFTGCRRGQCKTDPIAHEVDPNAEDKNKPEIKSYVVIDEPAVNYIRLLTNGTLADGRVAPKSWSVGEDLRWLNEASIAANSSPFRARFEISKAVKCRDFLEKEILLLMSAVLTTDGQGRLTWVQKQLPVDAEAGSVVLDETNLAKDDEIRLKHIKSDVHPSIKIEYEWDEVRGKALMQVTYRDLESEQMHEIAPLRKQKNLLFKGLRSGIHTSTQLDKLSATFGDEYFYEKQSIVVSSLVNNIPLGTLVSVKLPNVKDDANGQSISLNRTMLVTASTYHREERYTSYTLMGSQFIQSTRQASQALHNLSIDEYKRGKINIADVPGINITPEGVVTGNIQLEMGKKYYYVNDASPGTGLQFQASMNIDIVGRGGSLQFYCMGPVQMLPTLDFTGRSNHAGGLGETPDRNATKGASGYVFDTKSRNGLVAEIYGLSRTRIRGFTAAKSNKGQYARAPDLTLSLNNGILGGVPSDLGGTAGPGGPLSISEFFPGGDNPFNLGNNDEGVTTYGHGGNGGHGGGGFFCVCWGGSFSNIITNGENGTHGGIFNLIFTDDERYGLGGSGGGGGPGAVYICIDGNHSPPVINGNNIEARYGGSDEFPTAERLKTGDIRDRTDGTYYTAASDTIDTSINHWKSVTRIVYTPPAEVLQRRAQERSAIEQFFADQIDRNVKMIISERQPTNANLDDMWIQQSQLDSTLPQPLFRVLRRDGWRTFNYQTDANASVYLGLIAFYRKYGTMSWSASASRPTDYEEGEAWTNTLTGETWILSVNGDTLVKAADTSVGENLYRDGNYADQQSANRRGVAGPWIIDSKIRTPRILVANTVANPDGSGDSESGAPRSVLAYVYNSAVEIIINSPVDESKVVRYAIYRDGTRIDNGGVIPPVRSFLDSAITPGVQYRYSASSVDQNGVESLRIAATPSVVIVGTANNNLPDVSGLTVSIYSGANGELMWNRIDDISRHTGFEITRSDGIDPVFINNAPTTNSYYFENMSSGSTYTWTVKTVASDGSKSIGRTVTGTAQ